LYEQRPSELPDATKQTKNRAQLFLATPQCRLAFRGVVMNFK